MFRNVKTHFQIISYLSLYVASNNYYKNGSTMSSSFSLLQHKDHLFLGAWALNCCSYPVSFNTTLICKPFTNLNFAPLVEHPCLSVCSEIKRKSWNQVSMTKQIHILFFIVVVQDIPRPLKCLSSVYNLKTTEVNQFLTT